MAVIRWQLLLIGMGISMWFERFWFALYCKFDVNDFIKEVSTHQNENGQASTACCCLLLTICSLIDLVIAQHALMLLAALCAL